MSWIGVDLDGTLAEYHGSVNTIGKPIEPMMRRVKIWLKAGLEVRIFTARANDSRQVAMITRWLAQVGLPPLKVTATKDYHMVALWDDRAVEVKTNTGMPINYLHQGE